MCAVLNDDESALLQLIRRGMMIHDASDEIRATDRIQADE